MKSLARSREKMNWRRGVPVPDTIKGVLFSARGRQRVRAGVRDSERTLGEKALVYEAGNDVAILEVVVVVRSKDVGRDGGGEVAAKLLVVRAGGTPLESARVPSSSLRPDEIERTGCRRPQDAFRARSQSWTREEGQSAPLTRQWGR